MTRDLRPFAGDGVVSSAGDELELLTNIIYSMREDIRNTFGIEPHTVRTPHWFEVPWDVAHLGAGRDGERSCSFWFGMEFHPWHTDYVQVESVGQWGVFRSSQKGQDNWKLLQAPDDRPPNTEVCWSGGLIQVGDFMRSPYGEWATVEEGSEHVGREMTSREAAWAEVRRLKGA